MTITRTAKAAARATAPEAPADMDAPDAERTISDAETLKALSDPLRLRILETLVTRTGEPWTVKELAKAIGVPQTRLYHHIDLLLERDLIRAAGQRVVSGIIETRYRVAALSFRLDHRLLSTDSSLHEAGRELLHTVFDGARDEVSTALNDFMQAHPTDGQAPGEHPDRPLMQRGLVMLSPAQAAEFRTRLGQLMSEYDTESAAPDAEPWGFLVAFYRVPDTSMEPSRD
jgi:DNA-binding transcriptional ArsR family regulator